MQQSDPIDPTGDRRSTGARGPADAAGGPGAPPPADGADPPGGAAPAAAGDPGEPPAADESGDGPGGVAEDRGAEAGGGAVEEVPEEGPRPLGVGVSPTGVAGVDALLGRLGDADHLTVHGHLEVYEEVHEGLRTTLTALDQAPGPQPGPPRPPAGPSGSGS